MMMNFVQSEDNAEMKRPKQSSPPITQNEEEEDLISRLPDEILTHILSLLPDADAYRTLVLSNRWNNLCFFLPFLCFKMPFTDDEEDVNKFYDFVDKTFALRGVDMPIKRFFLSCSHQCDYNHVLDWLRVVVRSKVEILEFDYLSSVRYRYYLSSDDGPWFCLSWDLFMTCNNTLVELTLRGVSMLAVDDDTHLLFPCLKRIKLEYIEFTGNQSSKNLIPACPVLQELFLQEQVFCSDSQTFKISSPTLKRLEIVECSSGDNEVVIDADKLEYFYIDAQESGGNCSLTNSSCLVEAHIYIFDLDVQLLTSVSSARILTLSNDSVYALSHNEDLNLPVFPNLVKLIVDYSDMSEWDFLFVLLNSMPNLQHITISSGYLSTPFKRRLNPPMEAPACLRFMVKEIVLYNLDEVPLKNHVTFIRYLLNHSSVLEKLTLHSNNKIDREGREKLLKIRRRSKSCRVEFV